MTAASTPNNNAAPKPVQIAAAVIGNALEWYDFIVFGLLTVIISRLFFPAESQYASLLLTTATFGVGFFMRPVGGILLGIYADRSGRKAALILIIVLMTVAMAMISFAPTYRTIGVRGAHADCGGAAVAGICHGRRVRHLDRLPHRKRTAAPPRPLRLLANGGAGLGRTDRGTSRNAGGAEPLAGSARQLGLAHTVSGRTGDRSGRAIYQAASGRDASVPGGAQRQVLRPGFRYRAHQHLRGALVSVGIVTAGTISFYVILLYMPTFALLQLHLPLAQAFIAQSIGVVCMIVLTPLFGALSDRIGRKPVMIVSLAFYLVLTYPLFSWLYHNPSFGSLVIVQIVFCSLLGAFFGPSATAVAEQFEAQARSTGLGIAYNMAVMIFGGFAQFFVTWLIEVTGSPIAPSFYVMFGAALGVLAAFFLVDRARDARLPELEGASACTRTA